MSLAWNALAMVTGYAAEPYFTAAGTKDDRLIIPGGGYTWIPLRLDLRPFRSEHSTIDGRFGLDICRSKQKDHADYLYDIH
jgi:hypothetical protein